ncbi:hypothetical protein EO95_10660 [Methanosarcina sp. 1.H.T.1A.1]|uniref:hypothetical protein n=1 Tax=Methanosarcina sp. 1.H.T.1A.1 TaxID=1483602 RepID=UPI000622B1BE|nr:hypothetical protein [Methanosarcina sp. 1.H.T.1A.1]KKH97234.1 hypothetical protein EO95_10660 [Methanosarcina sp. 1.H.T.1A.1]
MKVFVHQEGKKDSIKLFKQACFRKQLISFKDGSAIFPLPPIRQMRKILFSFLIQTDYGKFKNQVVLAHPVASYGVFD